MFKKILLFGLFIGLAACTLTPPTPPSPSFGPPTVSPTPTLLPLASATPVPAPTRVNLWLPPDFAPDTTSPGGPTLAEQLAQFEQTHPGLQVAVRLKAATGPGGLLNALTTAYNVAPTILPDVIALTPDDLRQAAVSGLVIPLDSFFSAEARADYYPFAQTIGHAGMPSTVGLPFAADLRLLAYYPADYPAPPLTWSDILTSTLIIPGGESPNLTLVQLYLDLGGGLTDAAGNPRLDTAPLAEALTYLQTAQKNGQLSSLSLAHASPATTWQTFRERRASLVVTSAHWYLAEHNLAPAAAAAGLPSPSGHPLGLTYSWSWAIVNTTPERQALAAQLLAHLTAAPQLAAWTRAAQYLPPRAAALALWEPTAFTAFADQALNQAEPYPASNILAAVGPPLQKALTDVLNNQVTPLSAATLAAQTVQTP